MSTVIVGGTIFTGTGELLTNGSVLIDEGRIAAIGRDVRRPCDARVIDVAGRFVMAGFIDAHSHLALVDVPERPEPHPDTAFLAVRAAREKLASGVTAVRDLG